MSSLKDIDAILEQERQANIATQGFLQNAPKRRGMPETYIKKIREYMNKIEKL